jgi:hypothetical protein
MNTDSPVSPKPKRTFNDPLSKIQSLIDKLRAKGWICKEGSAYGDDWWSIRSPRLTSSASFDIYWVGDPEPTMDEVIRLECQYYARQEHGKHIDASLELIKNDILNNLSMAYYASASAGKDFPIPDELVVKDVTVKLKGDK